MHDTHNTKPTSPEFHPAIPNPGLVASKIAEQAQATASDILAGDTEESRQRRFIATEKTTDLGGGLKDTTYLLASGPSELGPSDEINDDSVQAVDNTSTVTGMKVEATKKISRSSKFKRWGRKQVNPYIAPDTEVSSIIVTPDSVEAVDPIKTPARQAEIAKPKPTAIVHPTVVTEVVKNPDGSEVVNSVRVGDDHLGRSVVEVITRQHDGGDDHPEVSTMRSTEGDTSLEALRTEQVAQEIASRVMGRVAELELV